MADCKGSAYLNVDLSDVVGFPDYLIVCDWNDGMGWHLYVDGELESSEWYETNHLPLSSLNISDRAWFQSIPERLQAKVLELDETNTELVFPLLCLMAHYRSVLELFEDAPLLTLLLLVHAIKYKMCMDDVVILFASKRTELMAVLNLPASKSAWKILGKLEYTVLDNLTWTKIQAVFELRHWQCLSHQASFDVELLLCVEENPYLLHGKLLAYCSHQATNLFLSSPREQGIIHSRLFCMYFERQASYIELKELYSLMLDTTILLQDNYHRRRTVLKMDDEAALLHLHDTLAENNPLVKSRSIPIIDFPHPPIEGKDKIQPIRKSSDLIQEGKEQHHCVACYWQRIANGNYYVYRMLEPERATIGLVGHHDGQWHLDQLRLCRNAKPSNEAIQMVNAWLLDERQ